MYMMRDLQVLENDETLILRYFNIASAMSALTQSIIIFTVIIIGEVSKI
jgi:hypothetical protein